MATRWLRRMNSAFGASFIWLVALIYFTQGFRSFVWTSVSYLMKDSLQLSPSASQFLVSVAYFPWSIKPLYGILSDCIPIRGRKRVPYLILATVLSLFPWLLLGFVTSLRDSHNSLTAILTVQNLGSAMADVVIDAMVAEAVRFEQAEFSGDLQSLSWLTMALGGICGSLLGGYTLSKLSINTIFLIFSLLPAIQLLSCSLITELPATVQKTLDQKTNGNKDDEQAFISSDEDKSFSKPSKYDSSRRRKNSHKKSKRNLISIKPKNVKEDVGSIVARCYSSVKSAISSLCSAFKQPSILRPMAWFFISHITIPNLSTVMFYYQTEVLHLEASFLGTARVVGWFGLMLGTFAYNRFLRHMNLRKLLMFTHIGLATVNFLDVVLVSRLNIQLSIPDVYMVLFGSAFGDAINQFKMMPFLIISGQLCPPGIEGTLFALFMSINNLGSTLGSFLGAALASVLSISSDSFDNLQVGLVVQLLSNLIPISLLFLIPKGATGLKSK